MPDTIDGKTVLIVGASSGIGAATAQMANGAGARTILVGRSEGPLATLAASLPHPDRAIVRPADYLDPASLSAALEGSGPIDHVTISAVADENAKRGRIDALSDAVMRASFDKFWGQVHTIRAALPHLSERASITLFSSIAGFSPTGPEAGLSVMNGVQAAVMQTGRSLARELAPRRVNIVAPGVVLTNVWTAEKRAELQTWMETAIPARHAGQPEDIAQAVLFLMTNPYVTGIVLPVDGGLSLQ
ncbi:MAG: SDR family oxidoreductase [Pseudomonadota bacterium]